MTKICFCKKNKDETKKLYKFLQRTYKEVKVKRKDCLGKCKACKKGPFALIDGEMVKGNTVDELFCEVTHRLTKEWWEFRGK
ncbi:uncharacterized protein YuzB (UPF0349 family) [Anoxybacillus voinovskiensis]|uniref:Uncharacterized protein YuzB (UPF0349 family) n=1 Tax=Anoxybacteroides voinovskiense TaxID=230470 RepID=A0A840DH85_9BACL|nr:DUF1450 domain-containing protein [Anoxybacillus voinovskiensis]MBB4072434.1 uncharacterized protein YuzB (UPF0349 family) [Anoxybacillus voinovskiensis]GGJ57860.1 hypothetical protein GCM10008982_03780 [Anoxybacillus voinovskiensis]